MLCKGEEKQPISRRVITSTTPGKFLMRSVSKSFIDCYLTISSALKKPGQRKNKIQNAQSFLRLTRNTHALHTRKSEELPKGAQSTEKCFVLVLSYSKYAKFPSSIFWLLHIKRSFSTTKRAEESSWSSLTQKKKKKAREKSTFSTFVFNLQKQCKVCTDFSLSHSGVGSLTLQLATDTPEGWFLLSL